MTLATTSKSIDSITHEDYERIKQTAQQARPGENPEEAALRRAIGIAAIGLMKDAMLQDDEATTARWSDLEQAPDGSGRLFIRPSKTSHTDNAQIAYVSRTTMDALAAMATAQQELGARASQDDTILPADSETLLKHISDACSSAGLNGTYVADSPRAGMTLDLLQSDFTTQQVLLAGRWDNMSTFSRFVFSITGGRTVLEELLAKQAVVELDSPVERFFRMNRRKPADVD